MTDPQVIAQLLRLQEQVGEVRSSTVVFGTGVEPPADATLQRTCDAHWDRIKLNHQPLSNGAPIPAHANSRRAFLEYKIRHYEHHLRVLQDADLDGDVPTELPDTTVVAVHAALVADIAQHETLLAAQTQRIAALRLAAESRTTTLAEHEQLAGRLAQQMALQEDAAPQDSTGRMRDKIKLVVAENKKLLKGMATFGREYFPAPDVSAILASKRQRQGTLEQYVQTDLTFVALNDILEALMNASIKRAHDPYVTLDAVRHWPPHIELLLRWGIAVKHPQNATQIKLVEFHL